jgi:transaldolase
MKIFIDSADIDEIEKAYSYGVLDGVTTNPSLIKKASQKHKVKDMNSYIKKILKVARGTPVSLEVIGSTYDSMVKEGKKLYKMFNPVAKNVYIKVPVNPVFGDKINHFDGLKAIQAFSKAKIPVNCTLIFTPEQALLAAKAGAAFVSPFAGRIDDYIRKDNGRNFNKTDYFPEDGIESRKGLLNDNGIVSGVDLIAQIVEIFDNYQLNTEVLAASIRNSRQARESALAGANIATLPLSVIEELLIHPKTIEGMAKFTEDIVPEYAKLLK